MENLTPTLKFILQFIKIQSLLTRRFDGGLNGISLNEFMILYYLSQAREERLRRVDLANKIGLTASGITRLLLPMEKVGLLAKVINVADARVSYVMLAKGGKIKLKDTIEYAESIAEEVIIEKDLQKLKNFSDFLLQLGGSIQ